MSISNKGRSSSKGLVVLICILLALSILFIFFNPFRQAPPEGSADCTPKNQYPQAIGFKGDVLVLGLIGAIIAGLCFYLIIYYQIFFPGPVLVPWLVSVGIGIGIGFLLVIIDYYAGTECLRKSLGSNSGIDLDEVVKKNSISGYLVGSLWLSFFIDFLLFSNLGVTISYFFRKASYRR